VTQALISIIIPMYNEEENTRPIYHALDKVFKKIPYDMELLFVDDGSKDSTVDHLADLADKDPRVRPIELARNFGKEIALSAGLQNLFPSSLRNGKRGLTWSSASAKITKYRGLSAFVQICFIFSSTRFQIQTWFRTQLITDWLTGKS